MGAISFNLHGGNRHREGWARPGPVFQFISYATYIAPLLLLGPLAPLLPRLWMFQNL